MEFRLHPDTPQTGMVSLVLDVPNAGPVPTRIHLGVCPSMERAHETIITILRNVAVSVVHRVGVDVPPLPESGKETPPEAPPRIPNPTHGEVSDMPPRGAPHGTQHLNGDHVARRWSYTERIRDNVTAKVDSARAELTLDNLGKAKGFLLEASNEAALIADDLGKETEARTGKP